MNSEIFRAGIAPGAPITENEIKTLICFIISKTGSNINFDILHDALRENNYVNYFQLVQSVEELIKTGHIKEEGISLILTALGKDTVDSLASSLPASVCEKSVNSAKKILAQSKRRQEVKIEEEKLGSGYMLTLSLPDKNDILVSVKIMAMDTSHKELIKKRFLNDPVFIYQNFLALLTGDTQLIKEEYEGGMF